MAPVLAQLVRIARGEARARAGVWARQTHFLVLLVAVAGAAVTRWIVPLPVWDALAGRFFAVLLAAALLWAAYLGLKLVARPWLTPSPARMARRLDDEQGWKDAATTALDVERGRATGALAPHLTEQVTGLLAAQALPTVALAPQHRPWLRLLLTFAFVVVLLLPGVRGWGSEGAGRGGEIGVGWREQGDQGPMDADRWMREHMKLTLELADLADLAGPKNGPPKLRARWSSTAPLPAAYRGELALLWDDAVLAPVAELSAPKDAPAKGDVAFGLKELPELELYLTPGMHRARVRLAPLDVPFTQALRSNEIEVEIPPPSNAGGGGGGTPPPPPPTPPPPQPAPPPPSPPPAPPPPTGPAPSPKPQPPMSPREEAVTPFVNQGDKVKKENAVVAVRSEDAGLKTPPPKPLGEALREFDKVVERAVGGERITPSDQALVRRYFALLRALTEPAPPVPAAPVPAKR